MALRKVRNNIDRIFDKSLADLIRGIRNNKENEAKYVAQCLDEIKQELRQDSLVVKTNAIQKLTYLQMMGYDISWASFNIIEVMSSVKFTDKRIGYLAASQCFHDETDVLMLTTNLIRKDLNSTNVYDSGVALGGLACFINQDLARDLANDVVTLLSSSRPYIRKRAVLLLYKTFLKYPESLRPTFARLKERLEDADPGVQSAAVNVICELARKNPKNYLSLAPIFFKLMTTSSNNWMLIKIIKLFGALVPLEPRLGKKLLEPLTNLINNTSAMSLLYECINTVIAVLISVSSGTPGDHSSSIQLCVQKLGVLIEDADQNLKYLGLLAMGKILQTHPKAVQAHKDVVLSCLDDKDESIRLRALDLLYGMVSKKNIMEIVKKLMEHVDAAEGSYYRDELLSRIIQICSHNNYQYISNFEWYVSVLVELTKVEGTKHGPMIAEQVQDVTVRVQSIRHFAVSQMALLIENAHLLLAGSAQHRSNVSEVLLAAAWICGEYSQHVRNVQSCLESMLKAKVSLMPGHIQSTFIQNIGKLYSVQLGRAEAEDDWDQVESLDNLMLSKLPQFQQTEHLEAQERACTLMEMMRELEHLHEKRQKIAADVTDLFEGELNPVAPKAQRKVPLPNGLDLDVWINEPPAESSSSESEAEYQADLHTRSEFTGFGYSQNFGSGDQNAQTKKKYEPTTDEIAQMREQRMAEMESNPYYVKGDAKPAPGRPQHQRPQFLSKRGSEEQLPDTVPALDVQSPLQIPGVVGLNRYLEQQESTLSWKKAKKEKKIKKKSKKNAVKARLSSSEEELTVVHQVNRDNGEMPEGAKSTDDEDAAGKNRRNGPGEDPYRALDMDLDSPLRAEERLPVARHRPQQWDLNGDTKKGQKKKKEKEKLKEKGTKTKIKKRSNEDKLTVNSVKSVEDETAVTEVAQQLDDMDFWLSAPSGQFVDPEMKTVAPEQQNKVAKKKLKSLEKEKKVKKKETGKRRQKQGASGVGEQLVDNTAHHLAVRDKNDYEVASGVCTPSSKTDPGSVKEGSGGSATSNSPSHDSPLTVSSYRILAQNDTLKLTYETRVSTSDANQVAVGMVISNVGTNPVRQLQMNTVDTLNATLIRDAAHLNQDGSVTIPFNLSAGASNEHVFRFSIQTITLPQKLRGTFTFTVDTPEGATPDKLDFNLRFPCISFTVPATISPDSFEQLLSSGEVAASRSQRVSSNCPFQSAIGRICSLGHFSVVEEKKSSVSLYSQTIQAQPICVLVKALANSMVSLDGKSSDLQLITSVVDELRDILNK